MDDLASSIIDGRFKEQKVSQSLHKLDIINLSELALQSTQRLPFSSGNLLRTLLYFSIILTILSLASIL